jgi:hypothetical protein
MVASDQPQSRKRRHNNRTQQGDLWNARRIDDNHRAAGGAGGSSAGVGAWGGGMCGMGEFGGGMSGMSGMLLSSGGMGGAGMGGSSVGGMGGSANMASIPVSDTSAMPQGAWSAFVTGQEYQQQAKRAKPFYEAILSGLVPPPTSRSDGAGQQAAQKCSGKG